MVLNNPFDSNESQTSAFELSHAPIVSRIISAVLDYFILSPIAMFLSTVFMKDGLRLLKESSEVALTGPVLTHMIVASGIFFALMQTIFVMVYGGTPGQILLKLRMRISNPNFSSFLLIFFRQIGFVISGLFLGLPWLAIVYHPRRQAFYEKMTDTQIVSLVREIKFNSSDLVNDGERRYVGMAFSTAVLFVLVLFVVEWRRSFLQLLDTPQVDAAIGRAEHGRCPKIESRDPIARLQMSIAMNFVQFLSDECVHVEVDSHLWKNFSSRSDLVESWSYLARASTIDSGTERNKYIELACSKDSDFDSCRVANLLKDSKSLAELDLDFLPNTSILKQIVFFHQGEAQASALDPWKNMPLIKKYILAERVRKLATSDRKVASEDKSAGSKEEELKEIVDLIRGLK